MLDFAFRVIQLSRLNWRDFVRRPNPVAAALMAKMWIAPGDRPRVKLECLRLIATLKLDPARQTLIRGFVGAYPRLSREEARVYNQELETVDAPEREHLMQYIDEFHEWAAEEGIRKGETGLIVRLLRRRFGDVPDALRQRIFDLPHEKLEELAEAVLDFDGLPDAEAWGARNA